MEMPKKLYNFAVHFFQDYGKLLQTFLDQYFPPMDFGERKSIGLNREENIGMPDPAQESEHLV